MAMMAMMITMMMNTCWSQQCPCSSSPCSPPCSTSTPPDPRCRHQNIVSYFLEEMFFTQNYNYKYLLEQLSKKWASEYCFIFFSRNICHSVICHSKYLSNTYLSSSPALLFSVQTSVLLPPVRAQRHISAKFKKS